jgi:ribosomal protein L7/L12
MEGSVAFFLLVWVLGFGLVAAAIWSGKGGTFLSGFAWGALLGFFGVIYVAVAKPRDFLGPGWRQCPHCMEAMRAEATTCPHCHERSSPGSMDDVRFGSGALAGRYALILVSAGEQPATVARKIKSVCQVGSAMARKIVATDGPVLLLDGLAKEYAEVLKEELEAVGATAEVE